MAAALPNPVLSKSKFHNWIKAALAVLFTKEEIEPVAYDEILKFQQRCLQNIETSNSLQAGSTCNICCTENLIVCPNKRLCNVRDGNCSYHRNTATKYNPLGCPNKICHNLKTDIQKAHRHDGPSYKNTDAKQWCSNPWEIAKCFMPPDGYKDVTCAKETDFNGIISVIINHTEFDAKMNDDLSQRNNIFDKGREVGKAIRHSPDLEVEDTDLARYFTILDDILKDTGFISISISPRNARQKLAQLQNDELVIGKDVVQTVLQDAGKAIQEQIKDEISEYKQVTEDQKQRLLDSIETKVKEIEVQGNISLTKVYAILENSVDSFKALVQESFKEIKRQVEEGSQLLKDTISKQVEEGSQLLKDTTSKQVEEGSQLLQDTISKVMEKIKKETAVGSNTGIMSEDLYQRKKQDFKEQLVNFYKNKRSTVPLSPLVEEVETELVRFYVMPDMVSVEQTSLTSHKEERTPVRSLRDLFITGSKNQHEIYVSADAGFGKTSFSKYLAITWGQACCPDDNKEFFNDEELKALADFDFLFLVILRDSAAACSIDKMIEHQIIKKLPPSASECPLQDILDKEKCLIILDGLDEWTHPENGCPDQSEKIPHRYVRENCVILTTTRPWKLGVSNLKTGDINKKVELEKLSEDSVRQLEVNAIWKMKGGVKDNKKLKIQAEEFDRVTAERGLEYMHTIPLLLMYITCLWCNNRPIGDSLLQVYVNIIEFLLSRTAQKHPEVRPSSQFSDSDIPDYLKNHEFCQKFYSVLTALAELAYRTLFSDKRENTLVFDGSVAKKYLKDDMKICLLSGILTESTTTTLIERKSKVSFSHKTVQEFFAAMFICSHSNAQKTVLEKCKNVQSILDMSMICEFLSKMNSNMMCEILPCFMSVINEDEKTRDYRNRINVNIISREPLYNIQKMLLSCLREMPESENIKLCLQDFFIDDDDTIHDKNLQRLSKLNQTNMNSLYINMSRTSSSFREILELFSLTDLNNLQKLYYRGGWKEADISVLFSMFTNCKIVVCYIDKI